MYTLIAVALLALVISALYPLYVNVVKRKNAVFEALSGIDVQLKKRYDLIPNILTIAKKFMEHESEVFEKITELRTQAMKAASGTKEKFDAEAALDSQMKALMVNVENYPALKSDATMVQAMQTYNEVEEQIAGARKTYNSALKELKNMIEIFPGSLFAGCAAKARELTWFEIDENSRQPVDASKYL